MADFHTYIVVDELDSYVGEEHDTFQEACNYAEALNRVGGRHAVVEFTYEFADSSLVWAPNNEATWPPKNEEE